MNVDDLLEGLELAPVQRKTHCLRGHPYTKWNTLWSVGQKGTPQRSCRRCRMLRLRRKYRTDEAYRAKERERARRNKQKRAANLTLRAISSVSSD